ncbi:MAG: thioredoxin family protein [Akkermansia sp.]|nr:thioredoxin family protein [Akkermansia sp.]
MFKNILYATGLAAAVAPAFAALEWTTDLDEARTRAAAESKSVLVDFTGSDWCGYCIQLKKTVFDTPEFEALAKDDFLFVEIDVPRDVNRIGQELYSKNEKLCKQYKIAGFPTIMVMSPEGYIIGGFVGGSNMARTKDALSAAKANAEKVAKAKTLQGSEKAKLLAEVHASLARDLKPANSVMVNDIAEADTDNVTGMKDMAKAAAQMEELEAKLNATRGNAEKALPIINEAIKNAYPVNLEDMLMTKGQIIMALVNSKLNSANSIEDVEATHQLMLELVDCAPADRKEIFRQKIEKDFADPATILEKIRKQRGDK